MRSVGSELIKNTDAVPPLTFSVTVARLDGQTARDGYTRNCRVRPARLYPIKLVDRATRTTSPG
jgi:hypothetical protein